MSECKHEWRTVRGWKTECDICGITLAQENADLRAKLEQAEQNNKCLECCKMNELSALNNELSKKVGQQVMVMRGALEEILPIAMSEGYLGDGSEFIRAEEALQGTSSSVQELEKFAELGRLALTTRGMVCGSNDFKKFPDRCENHCIDFSYCKLRAELLAGGVTHAS